MTREDVVKEARTWIGTRWLHQASVKGIACDCIGLIAGVARNLGVKESALWASDSRRLSYGREPVPEMLKSAAAEYLEEKTMPLVTGDVVLMIPPRGKLPQHFAIVSGERPLMMIHAYAFSRGVVENRIDEIWFDRIVGVYCFKGL